MSEVFLGQIMMAGFSFAPRGFALADGGTVPIRQNSALFSLFGTAYGGDGINTFGLPNLLGRTPVGFGASVDPSWNPSPYELGAFGGSESVTLSLDQLPTHAHQGNGTSATGTGRNPTDDLFGTNSADIYGPVTGPQVTLSADTVAATGGGQPHENMQPYSVISFCIAMSGIYPSRG
jgi:microcystin-dependent protein